MTLTFLTLKSKFNNHQNLNLNLNFNLNLNPNLNINLNLMLNIKHNLNWGTAQYSTSEKLRINES